MPLLRINATANGLILPETPQPIRNRLFQLATHPGPAIIMIHGYKYAPGIQGHCPHQKLFGDTQYSWPRALGFGTDTEEEGLGIALGWYARGTIKGAHKRAMELGESLAIIVALLHKYAPQKPVHLIGHSLGAETVLSALPYLPAGAVDRIILLAGASHAARAARLLATPAGRAADVLNMTSRENDLFDAAFERVVPNPEGHRGAIGDGITAPNALNIQIDCPDTLDGLETLGFGIAPTQKNVCHSSTYKRDGVMGLYHRFLRHPSDLTFATLARVLPHTQSPRWSRLKQASRAAFTFPQITLPQAAQSVGLAQNVPSKLRRPKNEPAY
ncbi:MAG: hypothetical protein AB8B47_14895 [Roseobacter sp.]